MTVNVIIAQIVSKTGKTVLSRKCFNENCHTPNSSPPPYKNYFFLPFPRTVQLYKEFVAFKNFLSVVFLFVHAKYRMVFSLC